MRAYTINWFLDRREPLPEDFRTWILKNVAKKFLYFERLKKDIKAWCSGCRTDVKLEKARSGGYTECPHCKARAKMIDVKTATCGLNWHEVQYIEYLQKDIDKEQYPAKDYYMVRIFKVDIYTSYKSTSVDMKINELEMDIYRYYSTQSNYFKETNYSRGGDCYRRSEDWRRGRFATSYGSNVQNYVHYLYSGNLQEIFKNTEFEYSSIWEYAERFPCKVPNLMIAYRKFPQLEYLIKLKAYRIIRDMFIGRECFNFNNNTQNIIKFLGLQSNKELQTVIDNNYGLSELNSYKLLKLHNKIIPLELIEFVTVLRKAYVHYNDLIAVMPARSFYDYYTAQNKIRKVKPNNFYRDYKDYINACKFLNYNLNDTQISKPKDFYKMHDRVLAIKEQMQNKTKWDKFARVCKKLKLLYSYSGKEYSVIAPSKATDLKEEGKALNHCVGGYIDRVADGQTIILFVRANSAKAVSLITFELNPKTMNIVQIRGYKDCDPPAEIKKFINEWEQKIISPLKKQLKAS